MYLERWYDYLGIRTGSIIGLNLQTWGKSNQWTKISAKWFIANTNRDPVLHACLAKVHSFLKTLFNIWRLHLKIVELWGLCCMMIFRWTIKQPGIEKFWNLCGLYQDIYDWISPLNKRCGRSFILTQGSMGRNDYGISGHLHIFAFLKHLMVLLRCIFFRASFLHLIKDTDGM